MIPPKVKKVNILVEFLLKFFDFYDMMKIITKHLKEI